MHNLLHTLKNACLLRLKNHLSANAPSPISYQRDQLITHRGSLLSSGSRMSQQVFLGTAPVSFSGFTSYPSSSPTQRFNSTQLLCISRLLPPVRIHGTPSLRSTRRLISGLTFFQKLSWACFAFIPLSLALIFSAQFS